MSSNKEHMRKYMLERFYKRKDAAMDQLGGKCSECGCEDRSDLRFHHIDPTNKSFTIGNCIVSVSEKRLQEELEKCILLCHDCHVDVHRKMRASDVRVA